MLSGVICADPGHASSVASVLNRSCTTSQSGWLGSLDDLDRDLSDLSVRLVKGRGQERAEGQRKADSGRETEPYPREQEYVVALLPPGFVLAHQTTLYHKPTLL